jgi:hypothetical protein
MMSLWRQMFRYHAFWIAVLLPLAVTTARSQTVDEMQAIMNRPQTFCLQSDLREYNFANYHECDKYQPGLQNSQCLDEVTRRNGIIGKWNELVRHCNASGNNRPPSSPVKPTNSVGTGSASVIQSDLSRARELVKKKAQDADRKNEQALTTVKQLWEEEQERLRKERRKLDAQRKPERNNTPPSTCDVYCERCRICVDEQDCSRWCH